MILSRSPMPCALRSAPRHASTVGTLATRRTAASTRIARFLAGAAVALVLCSPRHALADEKTEFYIQQLKTGDDFRLRTQAALALGSKGDEASVPHLCRALEDSNEAVRAASAGALGKLKKSAGGVCLQERLGNEKDANVKGTIEKSIKEIASAEPKSSSDGAIPANAKFYVSVGDTNNKTGRGKDEVDRLVKDALTRKLGTMSGYAVAPRGEPATKAKALLTSKRLKGFQLLTTIERPDYSGGSLTVKVRVVLTTYPGKDIKGEFSPKLTQSGTPSEDRASEDELIKMALDKAMESFQKVVAAM